MSDATVFVSLALLGVWMQRKRRWALFFGALEGKYGLITNLTSGSNTSTSSGQINPSTVPGSGGNNTGVCPNGYLPLGTSSAFNVPGAVLGSDGITYCGKLAQ